MQRLSTIFLLLFCFYFGLYPAKAENGTYKCQVVSVIDGETFKCEIGALIKIWGIDAPDVPPVVSEKEAKLNGGFKARNYLKSYILNQTLDCRTKGMMEGGMIARCTKDLKETTIDIADPILIKGLATEDKTITKGYYSDPKRLKSQQ